jgi:hypothetical protein
MDSGTVIGIFFLGTAVGALLESVVRLALKHKLEQDFVDTLKEHVSAEDSRKL